MPGNNRLFDNEEEKAAYIEALEEAKRRWGEGARVRCYKPAQQDQPVQYKVGVNAWTSMFRAKGVGSSWEEAFSRADKTNKRSKKSTSK
jgi:hypothetical protein